MKKGSKMSEKSKELIRQDNLKNPRRYWSGKKRSEDTCKKIGLAQVGRKQSDETKNKRLISRMGYKHSSETIEKIRKANKGKKPSVLCRLKSSEAHSGSKLSEEHKRKISESLKGCKAYQWLGGISFEPYGLEFNDDLKEVIRNRDRRKCQLCEKTELDNKEKLTVHHIDYDKRNNNPKNLISLCRSCHGKTGACREQWIKFFYKEYV